MAVDLKIIGENEQEVDLSTGLDFGVARKGVPTLVKFKVKNVGTTTARDVFLIPSTLNEQSEVSEEEYANQLKSVKWKSFGFNENDLFSKKLNIGDIKPNKFAEGTKTLMVLFKNANSCELKDVWTTGVTEFIDGKHIFKKANDNPSGQVGKRMSCPILDSCRDFETEFFLDFKTIQEGGEYQASVNVPIRINSKGDGLGYMFMIRYKRETNQIFVTVQKNARGMITNTDRDYGEKLFETTANHTFNKGKKIGLKVYNNALNQPTFEVKYGGEKLLLTKSYTYDEEGFSLSDKSSTSYENSGKFYFDFSLNDGDISCSLEDMIIKTEELEQFIYMKTVIGDDAQNKTMYKSSAIISYIED